ncbi:MAG: phosphotransferase [Candidatus Nanopelagicales bacterium]
MTASDAEVLNVLTPWLPHQRWFSGKGRRITELHMASRHPVPGVEGGEYVIVTAHLAGAAPQTYQVPILTTAQVHPESLIGRTSAGFMHDGMLHGPVVVAMLRPTAGDEAAQIATGESGPRAHWVPPHRPGIGYRALSVEQSNTSGVIGETTFVKVFRLLTPGANPDVEVHARLRDVGCTDVGSLHGWLWGGWLRPAGEDGEQMVHGHLAVMLDYFPDSVDGWALAGQGGDFREKARALGRTTARVHRDLRRAFPTETLGPEDTAAISRRLQARLSEAVQQVPQLAVMRERLATLVSAPARYDRLEIQRVHGDLHLGQALHTKGGWRIIDFEAEPGASPGQRAALDHPMRDVAGMVRSFAYAAARAGLADWRQASTASFLAGYADEGGLVDESLLTAYLVDKAAYEAVYETRNRPQWVEIPLAGLRDLAAG